MEDKKNEIQEVFPYFFIVKPTIKKEIITKKKSSKPVGYDENIILNFSIIISLIFIPSPYPF
jgi:hypothetical protein